MSTFSEFIAAGKPHGSLDDDGYIPVEARPAQGQRAGLFTRAIAALVDVAAVAAVVAGVWLGTYALLWTLAPAERPQMPPSGLYLLGGIVVLWASWTMSYATNGRSLGKWVMGIRIVSRKGGRMLWPSAALRALANIAFPLGLLWVIPSAQNRSVQDVVLRTSVIYAWTARIDTREL